MNIKKAMRSEDIKENAVLELINTTLLTSEGFRSLSPPT